MMDRALLERLKLMFVAGEHSADQHASRVILELKRHVPQLETFGYGGKLMEAAGMRLDYDLAEGLPIIGITQALRHLPEIRQLFRRARDLVKREQPDAVILVDYPGFNLRFARDVVSNGIPVIYFIAPQVWAWHASRIKHLARHVSLLLVIFPFEEELFRSAGIETYYVGHPLLDAPPSAKSREQILREFGFAPECQLIGLIPGSRRGELLHHLVPLLHAAQIIHKEMPTARFAIPRAHTVDRSLIENALSLHPKLPVVIADNNHAAVRGAMDFAICKSGTSTLELALAGVPMVVIYRVSWPTYLFGKAVVRTPWLSLVNIVAGENLVPELLQHHANGETIARTTLSLLSSPQALERQRAGFSKIRHSFGMGGCAKRVAAHIVEFLRRRREGKIRGPQ